MGFENQSSIIYWFLLWYTVIIYEFTQGNLGAKKIARSRFQSPVKKKIVNCDIGDRQRDPWVCYLASYKFWNVFDDKRKGNIMLFSIMELFTMAWTNHYFTFKGKEGLDFSSGPDFFPFAAFFLHCKCILFVNLQIFFY